jgi:hypothetical protein
MTLADFLYPVYYKDFIILKSNYLVFKYFGFKSTWGRLFQKPVVRTNFDIYVFLNYIYLCTTTEATIRPGDFHENHAVTK